MRDSTNIVLQEARIQAEAKAYILKSGRYLPAAEIARQAGLSADHSDARINKWKTDRTIFVVEHDGVEYFPLFGLDPAKRYEPYATLGRILDVFEGTKGGWGLAFWFAGLNCFLNDRRPQDLLQSDPDQVIAAAKDEMEEIEHN